MVELLYATSRHFFPRVKQRLHLYMQSTSDFTDELIHEVSDTRTCVGEQETVNLFTVSSFLIPCTAPLPSSQVNPTNSTSISTSLTSVQNPHRYCQKVYETIDALLTELEEIHHKHPHS